LVRTFIAIDIKSPNVLVKIENVMSYINSLNVLMKLVEIENLHLTLRFLGEVEPFIIQEIVKHVINNIDFKCFSVELKGIGAFPSINRPRVIWIGLIDDNDYLKSIKEEIDSRLIRIGISIKKEEFIPHLTIARLKSNPSNNLKEFIKNYSNFEFGTIKVDSIKLKKSTLTKQGPIYEDIATVQCKPI